MVSKPKKKEPTQSTEKGLEIPIPSREDWDATLDKLIKPDAPAPEKAKPEKG